MEMIWNELEGAPARNAPAKCGRGIRRQDWKEGRQTDHVGRPKRGAAGDADAELETCNHVIRNLKELPQYKDVKDARLNCRVCKANGATLFCESCGENAFGQLLALCSPFKSSTCMSLHCQTPV